VRIGITLRVMGPQATRNTLLDCARAAEDAGLDDLWVADHIAIPPDDAEGSEGRYLDPLGALAFLASATSRIGLGTAVLILPYRPALPTAKAIATVQELSEGRLRLGVGVGWMAPEFRALGVDRRRRGAITDETLAFLDRCFSSDEVELNGQRFLFRPRPARPPILVGGAPPVAVLTGLPLGDTARAVARAREFEAVGATQLIHGMRYADAAEYRAMAGSLAKVARELRGLVSA
jgi:alkanesulfonate monooxygenase SsuD/methylene tetrahydromethanopterin reductase-like flavin-dependent oxidoreductase (luciferase family)